MRVPIRPKIKLYQSGPPPRARSGDRTAATLSGATPMSTRAGQ